MSFVLSHAALTCRLVQCSSDDDATIVTGWAGGRRLSRRHRHWPEGDVPGSQRTADEGRRDAGEDTDQLLAFATRA